MARRRRRALRRPRLLGVVILLLCLAVAGMLLNGVISGASSSPAYRSLVNRSFAAQINTVFEGQRTQGGRLEALLKLMPTLSRATVAQQLSSLKTVTAESATIARTAASSAPSNGTGPLFTSITDARASGVAEIATAIESLLGLSPPSIPGAGTQAPQALAPQSSTAIVSELTHAGSVLAVADSDVGVARAKLLAAPGNAFVIRSVFVADKSLLGAPAMTKLVSDLLSSPSLAVVHDLSLVTYRITPSPLPNSVNPQFTYLPPTNTLDTQVTVQNQGNVDEHSVSVTVSLTSMTGSLMATAKMSGTVTAGGALTLVFPAMAVLPGSQLELHVNLAPPAGESTSAKVSESALLQIAPEATQTTMKP